MIVLGGASVLDVHQEARTPEKDARGVVVVVAAPPGGPGLRVLALDDGFLDREGRMVGDAVPLLPGAGQRVRGHSPCLIVWRIAVDPVLAVGEGALADPLEVGDLGPGEEIPVDIVGAMGKLKVHSRAEAVSQALRLDLF